MAKRRNAAGMLDRERDRERKLREFMWTISKGQKGSTGRPPRVPFGATFSMEAGQRIKAHVFAQFPESAHLQALEDIRVAYPSRGSLDYCKLLRETGIEWINPLFPIALG